VADGQIARPPNWSGNVPIQKGPGEDQPYFQNVRRRSSNGCRTDLLDPKLKHIPPTAWWRQVYPMETPTVARRQSTKTWSANDHRSSQSLFNFRGASSVASQRDCAHGRISFDWKVAAKETKALQKWCCDWDYSHVCRGT
jgi:hypothetical protein